MKQFEFVNYMKEVATRLKSIGHTDDNPHFFKVASLFHLDQLFENLNSAGFPALCVVDAPEGRLIDNESSNLLDLQYYYFFVINKAEIDNASSREAAITSSLMIVKQILSKMFRDKMAEQRNPFYANAAGLKNLNRDNVSYRAVGPIADNCHGMWCSFTLTSGSDFKYNSDDWNE